MKYLLRLKAWQMFLLLVVPYFFITTRFISGIVITVWVGFIIIWVCYIGIAMHRLLPKQSRPGIKYFKFSCLFLLIALVIVINVFHGYNVYVNPYERYGNLLFLLIPFHIYLTGSMFYIYAFAGRMLESALAGKLVGWSPKAFVLFWLSPIGVWYIQPRVNKLFAKHYPATNY